MITLKMTEWYSADTQKLIYELIQDVPFRLIDTIPEIIAKYVRDRLTERYGSVGEAYKMFDEWFDHVDGMCTYLGFGHSFSYDCDKKIEKRRDNPPHWGLKPSDYSDDLQPTDDILMVGHLRGIKYIRLSKRAEQEIYGN